MRLFPSSCALRGKDGSFHLIEATRSLAEQIDIHPNQLSWLINNSFGKNFNELINHYRVETFKIISKDPNNYHLTIEGLAYECGFNSKTVFNTYFKKETGLTPKQFIKQ